MKSQRKLPVVYKTDPKHTKTKSGRKSRLCKPWYQGWGVPRCSVPAHSNWREVWRHEIRDRSSEREGKAWIKGWKSLVSYCNKNVRYFQLLHLFAFLCKTTLNDQVHGFVENLNSRRWISLFLSELERCPYEFSSFKVRPHSINCTSWKKNHLEV